MCLRTRRLVIYEESVDLEPTPEAEGTAKSQTHRMQEGHALIGAESIQFPVFLYEKLAVFLLGKCKLTLSFYAPNLTFYLYKLVWSIAKI